MNHGVITITSRAISLRENALFFCVRVANDPSGQNFSDDIRTRVSTPASNFYCDASTMVVEESFWRAMRAHTAIATWRFARVMIFSL